MILKKLILHNFGLYAGTNVFDFNTDKPVILVGGMNGRGKTTLLESVLLALYGRRSFAFIENKLSYPAYLRKLVNASDGTLQTYIELTFTSGYDESMIVFRLRREWSAQYKEVNENVRVFKDDIEDAFLSDNWAMYIEEILPSAISNFFFFDGEKISELAVDATGEQMRNSIKTLLGIDVLDRLETDLKKILAAKSKKLADSEHHQQIQELRGQEDELDKHLTTLHHDIVEINTYNDTHQREITNLEAQFMAKGGSIGNNRTDLLSRKNRLEDELIDTNEQILELTSGELPLALVEPLLHKIFEASCKEQSERNERFAAQRINQLIDEFRNDRKTVTKQMESFISFVKSATEGRMEDGGFKYNLSENALLQAKLLSNSLLHDKLCEAKRLKEHRAKIKTELDEIENYLLIEVDEAVTGSIYAKIKELIAQIGANNERKKRLELEETEVSSQLTGVQRELAKLIEKSLSEMESMDESARVVRYTGNALSLLFAYRLRLQEQKTSVLAQTMTDCYKKIATKKNLIDRVEINTETLDFIYCDANGIEVDKKRLSAGEKQLMVVAMLWALAICSHNKLPVIIDTPLARLDTAHRERIVKAYFPFASQQTIILSTDAEINKHYYKLLKQSVGREYTLMYDDENKSTSIVEGYFGGGHA